MSCSLLRELNRSPAIGVIPQPRIYGFSQDVRLTEYRAFPEKRWNRFSLTPAESQPLRVKQNGKKPSYDSASKFTRKKGAGVLVL